MGLKLLEQGNEKEARAKFIRCIKKGSYYCAKKSAEALCLLGNIQEKNQAAENLIKLYSEKDSLLIAAKQFESSNETNKLIEITQNLNPETDKNELIKMRLIALKNRGDSSYETEVYNWYTKCPVSKEHYQFYRDNYEHPDFEAVYTFNHANDEKMNIRYTPEQFAINYRIELYKRNYTYTLEMAPEIIKYMQAGALESSEQLASDIGKSYLYGSVDFASNAAYFKQLATEMEEKKSPLAFYYWFYAGRLFEKAGVYYTQTNNAFEKAMNCASTPSQKDNALWYLLNNSLNFSLNTIIENIGIYAPQWNDPEYFEDLFEKLMPSLLASGKWNAFRDIYKTIDKYGSNETVAQYAYIYGRLVQEGLAEGDVTAIKEAFTRTLNAGSWIYYKILAANQLKLTPSEIEKLLGSPYGPKTAELNSHSEAAKILLEGYAFFGFPELIYPAWLELYQQGLPDDTYFYLADFLAKVGKNDDTKDYFTQATRIAARGQKLSSRNITKDELKQVYPTPYLDIVEKYCKKYDIKPSVIYALIRSESFFDADVTSSAGAIGLTQLMEFTGSDIAKRLRIQDYDLTDPEISINFGSYYLSELVRRCDNSYLQGFFAYNAGITRVRRWLQSSLIEFGKKSNMPADLYLETVPYAETREYGRKLISAAVMYQWLENSEDFYPMVEELLK